VKRKITVIPKHVQDLADNTDYCGYVVMDYNGYYGGTQSAVTCVGMALHCEHIGGEELAKYVQVWRLGIAGKYHDNPGSRIIEKYDYHKAAKELLGEKNP